MAEYTTERGITIDVVPIPLLLDKVRQAHPEPAQPTYTEHVAGGATVEVAITEQSAAAWAKGDPDGWAPHAEKWAAYQAQVEARRDKVDGIDGAVWKAIILYAIKAELPKDDTWVQNQAELGIAVPVEARARRDHYIRTEVIGGMRDVIRIAATANGSNLTEEALAAAEASFLGELQGQAAERLSGRAG